MSAPHPSLRRDARGATAIEFALVSPVLFMLMMGLGDEAFQVYAQSVLTGAVQKAARDDTLQVNGAATDAMDQKVESIVATVVPRPVFNARSARRTNFDNYASMSGEPFTDSRYPNNASGVYDGICNHGEPYIDVNSNLAYDSDLSAAGQGGASDTTRYTVTVTYRRLFPITKLLGLSSTATLSATTMLKNQPYVTQSVNTGTTTRYCS